MYISVCTNVWSIEKFLLRQKSDLMEKVSRSQDGARLKVPRKFLLGPISEMEKGVQIYVPDLVFSLDDRRSRADETIHHGDNRKLKHITVIRCLTASGEHVSPYVITS
jgi:hypothetical protein